MRLDPVDMAGLRRTVAGWGGLEQAELSLHRVEAEPDALHALPAILEELLPTGSRTVLITQDRRPFTRDGASLKPLVAELVAAAGFEVEVLELGDQDGRMESDFAEVDQVRRRLAPGRAVVALGSGKLCDVTKHACHLQEQRDGRHLGLVVVR